MNTRARKEEKLKRNTGMRGVNEVQENKGKKMNNIISKRYENNNTINKKRGKIL